MYMPLPYTSTPLLADWQFSVLFNSNSVIQNGRGNCDVCMWEAEKILNSSKIWTLNQGMLTTLDAYGMNEILIQVSGTIIFLLESLIIIRMLGLQLFHNEWEHYQFSPLYNDISVLCKLNNTFLTIWWVPNLKYTCTGSLKLFIEHRWSIVSQWLLKFNNWAF